MDRPELSELSGYRVKPRTLREYLNNLQVFGEWMPDEQTRCPADEMDQVLNEFYHYIYRERKDGLSMVSRVKAGLEFYCPEYSSKLLKTSLSLQEWRQIVHVQPHAVCPEGAAYLVAKQMIRREEPDAPPCSTALAVLPRR